MARSTAARVTVPRLASLRPTVARLTGAALILGTLGACNPYILGSAAFTTVPNAATGRNAFYHIDRVVGKHCSDSTYFDRPLRCVNDAD